MARAPMATWALVWALSAGFLLALIPLQRGAAALLKEDTAAQPAQPDTSAELSERGPDDPQTPPRPKKAAYAADRLIVKYKDSVEECVHCLLKARGQFKAATTDRSDSLDALHARFKVKAAKPVFRTEDEEAHLPKGRGNGVAFAALKQHDQDRVEVVKRKFPQRNRRAPKNATIPDLHHVYVLELEPGANIDEAVAAFSADPHVEYAQPDYLVEANWVPNDPYYSSSNSWGQGYDDLWGLKKIHAEEAWDLTKGEGVVVAVVDTGVDYTHPDLAANIWTNPDEIPNNGIDDDHNGYVDDVRGWDFISCVTFDIDGNCIEPREPDNDPIDRFGHGTHVSGTISAVGNNATGIIGVAPQATIMPLKGLNDQGSGVTEELAKALVYAAMNGADILSNSWGCYTRCPSDPAVEEAVDMAYALGVVVVFAAGNSSDDAAYYSPQNMAQVITVGATDSNDQQAGFSNWGTGVDVSAPGVDVLSLKAPGTTFGIPVGDSYLVANGTSMACPHVAGLAALVVSAYPTIPNYEVEARIVSGTDSITTSEPLGSGRIHASRTLSQPAEPHLIFADVTIDDSSGNHNGQLDPGEKIRLAVTLKNTWRDALGVQATLETNDPYATISQATAFFGDIRSGEKAANLTTPFVFSVGQNAPVGHQLHFTLNVVANDAQYHALLEIVETLPIPYKAGWPFVAEFEAAAELQQGIRSMTSSPVVGQLDGDRELEVVIGAEQDSGGKLYVLNHDGTVVPGWPKVFGTDFTSSIDSSPALGDLDGDGNVEVVVASRHGLLYAFHRDGTLVAGRWPVAMNGYSSSSPALADVNHDGTLEVFIGAGGFVYGFSHDGSPLAGWPQTITGSISGSPAIADLGGDGELEIVIGATQERKIYAWHDDGSLVAGWPVNLLNYVAPGSAEGYYSMIPSSPAIGDIDHDGHLEVVIAAREDAKLQDHVFVFRDDGTLYPGWPHSTTLQGVGPFSSPVLGDVDGNGNLEIAIASGWFVQGQSIMTNIWLWHHDGRPVDHWPRVVRGMVFASPIIADIDGDGTPEIMVNTFSRTIGPDGAENDGEGSIYAWHGDGSLAGGFPIDLHEWMDSTPAVADVDGDGNLELIAESYHKLNVWGLSGQLNASVLPWPMFGHDPQHTGYYVLPNHPPHFTSIGNKTVQEGQLLNFTVSAVDPDGHPLTYNATGLPEGATFIGQTFSWTPAYWQAGEYLVTFTASDGQGGEDTETITITVQDVPLQVMSLTDAPDPFSPNGDGTKDTVTINGAFDRPVDWRLVTVVINQGPSRVFSFPAGPATAVSALWDGKDQAGVLQPTGVYPYYLAGGVTSTGEQAQQSGTVTLDTTAPTITNVFPPLGTASTPYTTTNRYVGFSASLADNAALKEAKLFLDGVLVKTQPLTGQTATVFYTPATALSYTTHTYRLEVRDFSNNLTTISRSFIVKSSIPKPPPPPPR